MTAPANTAHPLCRAAEETDAAFSAALRATYGEGAGDARYIHDWEYPTEELRELSRAYVVASSAWRDAMGRINPLPLPCQSLGCDCHEIDRLAATTPPPVRVVRLAGGGIMGDDPANPTRDEYALSNAAHAADTTAVLIPFLTMPAGTWTVENGDEERIARHNATRARTAARFARLALGARS